MTLRALREERGFSRRDLAAVSRVSARTIEAIELGEVGAGIPTRRKLIAAFALEYAAHTNLFGALHRRSPRTTSLRDLRESFCLDQRQLARHAGLSRRTIQRIEVGTHNPNMDTRRRLLRVLDIPLERHREIFGPMRKDRGE